MIYNRPSLQHVGFQREKGVAAVELAFVVIMLLIIVAGIVEFGRAFWYYNALAKATRDGARFLSEIPVDWVGYKADGSGSPPSSPPAPADPALGITAQGLVVSAAVAANVSNFGNANAFVDCSIDNGISWAACANGTTPTDVRVRVSYGVTIGGMIPFFLPTGGGVTSFAATLAPHTTMRYMR